MPEKDNNEDYDSKKVCCLEKFVAHASTIYQSNLFVSSSLASRLPDHTMRCKSKPRLKYKSDDTSPVEQQTHLKMHDHVMEMDVIDNERKGMHQGE